jgi:hypothetical protein
VKLIALLDNNEFLEIDPTKLQLRQIESGKSAMGIETIVPQRNEDGTVKLEADGKTPLVQIAFRPLVTFAVDLVIPAPAAAPAEAEPEVEIIPPEARGRRRGAAE